MSGTSGDRHLRPDPRVRIGPVLAGSRRVHVETDDESARSLAGQATLSLLVDLLARQFGVVDQVTIAVPSVRTNVVAFPGHARGPDDSLAASLIAVGRRAAGGEVAINAGGDGDADVVIHVGARPLQTRGRLISVVTVGDGWSAFCSTEDPVPASPTSTRFAFGPHLAAALGADRAFRALRGVDVRGTFQLDLRSLEPRYAPVAETEAPVRLPAAYMVGLGAVGAAALYTLAASTGVSGTIVGIDPDQVDTTNRNRLLSADYADVGKDKSWLAARLTAGSGIALYPNRTTFDRYLSDPDRAVPDSLRPMEPFRFEYVLSCVDKNGPRNDIAGVLPRHVLAGSTDGLRAESAYYSPIGSCECLACNHPIVGPDFDGLVADVRALAPVDRLLRLEEMGATHAELAAIDDYLADPACGQVGEMTLRRLGLRDEPDWSVGFVSAASGIILAARFTALAISGIPDPAEFRLFLLGAGSTAMSQGVRKEACRVCGPAETAVRFLKRWPDEGQTRRPQRPMRDD
jgi:molybdopterin/thiamine biosynthesis adenylyltransferase